jgi:ribosomal protein RSM22 (predicted rRNA methylase)
MFHAQCRKSPETQRQSGTPATLGEETRIEATSWSILGRGGDPQTQRSIAAHAGRFGTKAVLDRVRLDQDGRRRMPAPVMSTPTALSATLATIDAVPGLATAVTRLAERYREGVGDAARGIRDDLDRQAYVAARMPATSAAVSAALSQCGAVLPSTRSVLDLGSGPGSALWAVAEACPEVTRFTAVERDVGLVALGQRLMADHAALATTRWVTADLRKIPVSEPHDLVVLSYVVSELAPSVRDAVIARAWDLAGAAVLVVETGTPRGFAACLAARTALLARGAHLAAPCPHTRACPLAADGDRWCHFRVRVARSRLHRSAKGGALGYEDEPFSLVCGSRAPISTGVARVLSTPKVHRGAVALTLCSVDGITTPTILRKERRRYDAAAELAWGDSLDHLP